MKLGLEVFLSDKKLQSKLLKGKRVSLICHPASVSQNPPW